MIRLKTKKPLLILKTTIALFQETHFMRTYIKSMWIIEVRRRAKDKKISNNKYSSSSNSILRTSQAVFENDWTSENSSKLRSKDNRLNTLHLIHRFELYQKCKVFYNELRPHRIFVSVQYILPPFNVKDINRLYL